MQTAPEEGRRQRREYVDRFLADVGLAFEALFPSTQKCLDEWARQARVVEDQPSANFGNVVVQLCKAVESELAAGLGSVEALNFLTGGALGQKSEALTRAKLDVKTKLRLESWGIKPGFVVSDLPKLLSQLAKLRRDTDSAHGNAEIRSANLQDSRRARQIAGQILRGVARKSAS